MDEKEIKEIVKRKGITEEVIGYEHFKGLNRLVLIFKPADNPHEEKSNGMGWYIDEKTKKLDTMSLFDMLDYTGKIEHIKF